MKHLHIQTYISHWVYLDFIVFNYFNFVSDNKWCHGVIRLNSSSAAAINQFWKLLQRVQSFRQATPWGPLHSQGQASERIGIRSEENHQGRWEKGVCLPVSLYVQLCIYRIVHLWKISLRYSAITLCMYNGIQKRFTGQECHHILTL